MPIIAECACKDCDPTCSMLAALCQAASAMRRDDIALHDDILELFPRYWAAVPPAYDYIAVGQIPRHFNISHEAVAGAACWDRPLVTHPWNSRPPAHFPDRVQM